MQPNGKKGRKMNIKYADLTVKKNVDYDDEIVKALENAGFILTRCTESYSEVTYIVAKAESEE